MTSDEKDQLVEDIEKANHKRQAIVERARLDGEFDLFAAWETIEEDEASISKRISAGRLEAEE